MSEDQGDSSNVCNACKYKFDDVCVACSKNGVTDKTQCPVRTGKCGHTFHVHCLSKCLDKSNTCPADGSEWHFVDEN